MMKESMLHQEFGYDVAQHFLKHQFAFSLHLRYSNETK